MPDKLDENNIQKLKDLKVAYEQAFSSEFGKKVLEDLKKKYFFKRTTYNEIQGGIFYSEGQRTVILHIEEMMNLDTSKLEAGNE